MKLVQSHFVHDNTLFELCYLQQHHQQQHHQQQLLELQQKQHQWQQRLKNEFQEFNKSKVSEHRTFRYDRDDYEFLPYFGTDFYVFSIVCLTAIVLVLWLFRKVNEVICRYRIKKLLCKENGEFFREQLEATAALLREESTAAVAAPVAVDKNECTEFQININSMTVEISEFQTSCSNVECCENENNTNAMDIVPDSTCNKCNKKEKNSNHCVICFRPTPNNPMELLPCGHSSWCAHCLVELWNYANNNSISRRRNHHSRFSYRSARFQTEPIHCPLCRRRVLFICPDYDAQSRKIQNEKSQLTNGDDHDSVSENNCIIQTSTNTKRFLGIDGINLSSLSQSEEQNSNTEISSPETESCYCTTSTTAAVINDTTEHVNVECSNDEEADDEDCSSTEHLKEKIKDDITLLYEYNTRFAPLIDLQQTKKASKSFPWYERCIHMLKVVFDAHHLPVLIAFRITLSHLVMFTYLLLPKDFIPDYYGVSLSPEPLSATGSQSTYQNYYYFYSTTNYSKTLTRSSSNNIDSDSIRQVCPYSQGVTDNFLAFTTQQLPVTYKPQSANWHNRLLELLGVAFEIVVSNSDQIFLFIFLMVLIGHVLRRILLKDILSTLE